MNIIIILSTVTSLLQDVEPVGSYPYTRKIRECFGTTSELHVDQTNNKMCLRLVREQIQSSQCNVFSGGVYYDIFFDNQPSWRTQQRDYTNETEKFCFPCLNNNCTFSKETQMVSAKLVNEIYESEIPIGAIVQQRTNTSNCFKQWINKVIRGPNEVEFKFYIQECTQILDQCALTKVVEESYDSKIISSHTWNIQSDQWDVIKTPQNDKFGPFLAIRLPYPGNNLNDGQTKSALKLFMQCPNHEVVLYTISFLVQYLQYPEIGLNRSAIIQDTYVKLQVSGMYPPFDRIAKDVIVKVDFDDTEQFTIINNLQFKLPTVNFSLIYLDCAYFQGFQNPINATCEEFLSNIVENYLKKLKLNFNFYFTQDDQNIYATQTISALSTGCWQSVEMEFKQEEIMLKLTPEIVECPFIKETKSEMQIFDQNLTKISSATIYYCNKSTSCSQEISVQCNSTCQTAYQYKTLLFSITSEDESSHSEIWVQQALKVNNPFRVNYIWTAVIGACIYSTIVVLMMALQRFYSKKKKILVKMQNTLKIDPLDE
uniref:Transmembrane protein n=1 Tax=Trepomonas sp. PC1 TaxID=1076344 RepID=A0A146K362_9EUKA|eukprot:JAP91313.1 hypothetical protein TPC1_17112 [Trepomonas sp. PC1]